MTLFELTRELFIYLVRFRERAATTAAPPLAEVRGDLLRIFSRMDAVTKGDLFLQAPYERVRYILVVFADEVVLTSGWEHGAAWQGVLLEKSYYGTSRGGEKFFELAADLERAPQDVLGVFYLCLALGFCGRYAPSDPELQAIKEDLLARLPEPPRLAQSPPPPAPGPASAVPSPHQRHPLLWSLVGGLLAALVLLVWKPWLPGPGASAVGRGAAPSTTMTTTTVPSTTVQTTTTTSATTTSTPATTTTFPPTTTTTPPPPPPPPPPARQSAYRLQVGVFVGPLQAGRLARRLQAAGIPAAVSKAARSGGKFWYRVDAGPFSSRDQAREARSRLEQEFGIAGIVKKIKP